VSVPLADADPRHPHLVERTEAGGALGQELRALGIVPGTRVRILSRTRGHLTLAVEDARYAVGTEVARAVLVRR
jgi:Fe2+ transport system protein FeoA